MNLDLELGRSADRVDVMRVFEGAPSQCRHVEVPHRTLVGTASIQQIDPVPHLTPENPPLISSSAWINQSFPASSNVVLRNIALDPQDKTRAWHHHTAVVQLD